MIAERELQKGDYLMKKHGQLYRLQILRSSVFAYYILWESGNKSWVEKSDFHYDYTIVERLGVRF